MYLHFRDRLEVVKTKKKEVLIGNPKRLLVSPYGLRANKNSLEIPIALLPGDAGTSWYYVVFELLRHLHFIW